MSVSESTPAPREVFAEQQFEDFTLEYQTRRRRISVHTAPIKDMPYSGGVRLHLQLSEHQTTVVDLNRRELRDLISVCEDFLAIVGEPS